MELHDAIIDIVTPTFYLLNELYRGRLYVMSPERLEALHVEHVGAVAYKLFTLHSTHEMFDLSGAEVSGVVCSKYERQVAYHTGMIASVRRQFIDCAIGQQPIEAAKPEYTYPDYAEYVATRTAVLNKEYSYNYTPGDDFTDMGLPIMRAAQVATAEFLRSERQFYQPPHAEAS